VLGLGNSDVQVLTAYAGKEVKKGLIEEGADRPLQEADSYLAGKLCWDLAAVMFRC
jgi:hypothetical protein